MIHPPDYALRSSLGEPMELCLKAGRKCGKWDYVQGGHEHGHLPLVPCPDCHQLAPQEPPMTLTRGTEVVGTIPGPIRCRSIRCLTKAKPEEVQARV